MLVDALREDFVFGPSGRMYMPYTRHLVERGSSNSYVAKARPPTVTMPRIKVRCHQSGGAIMEIHMRILPSAILLTSLLDGADNLKNKFVHHSASKRSARYLFIGKEC